MDKIKNKYEIIFGFVTLIISLSAFKDELAQIHLNLGYCTINLAEYLLYCVFGFSICLYLYIMETVFRDTKIGHWKIWDVLLQVAYFIFVFILLTPLILPLNILFYKAYSLVSEKYQEAKNEYPLIVSILTALINFSISAVTSSFFLKRRKIKQREEIEELEIKELDNASKLFNDGYYSHSVLESFKVLETHLFKILTDKKIRVQRYKINDIIALSLESGIITADDIPSINNIREMRNAAAHSDSAYTQQQAEFALNFVRKLIKRSAK